MKMCDDEVRVMHVHVYSKRSQHHAGQAAHGEQPHKAQGIQHRRVQGYGSLVESRGPGEDLDA